MSLHIHNKPAQGSQHIEGIDHLAEGWKRNKRAIGGDYTGSFKVTRLAMPQLTELYHSWLGNQIIETSYGIDSWQGVIWEMDLIKNGIAYRRTLDPRYWHNRVKILFTNENNEKKTDDWSENTDSSDIYGEMEMIYSYGGMSAAGAAALQAKALAEFAWPKSRTAGGITVGRNKHTGSRDGLYVTCMGFWHTMNWQYYESDQDTTAASTAISNMLSTAEFVTSGRIETNSLSINSEGSNISQRLGDLIEDIILQGGVEPVSIWKGGVYQRRLNYEQVPTTVDYVYRNGVLETKTGGMVIPELLEPGFYVYDMNAPSGIQPPGSSNVWDDPQVGYCNEVEFEAPNVLRLGFSNTRERIEVLMDQAV